jgi:hypothetical protein
MTDQTGAFCQTYGEDQLEAILDAGLKVIQRSRDEGSEGSITFSHIERHDAINYTFIGYFQHGEEEVCFRIQNGNWNGTVVDSFGEETDMEPPERYVYVLESIDIPSWGPNADETVEAYAERVEAWRTRNAKIMAFWRKEPWFQELERSINYDKMFAPGLKTDSHYRAKADARGLRIVSKPLSEVSA